MARRGRQGSTARNALRLDQRGGDSTPLPGEPRDGRDDPRTAPRAKLRLPVHLRTIYAKPLSLYQRQYPERLAVHRSVNQALLSGRLKKPLFCFKCFQPRRLDAHHSDYRKPLRVVWLCRPCHTHVHPHTQKNAAKKTWRWQIRATIDDMASAMARARR